jgi:hypothetical protein
MPKANLSLERLRSELTLEPETGHFRWRDPRKDGLSHGRAGYDIKGKYRGITIDGERYMEHRLAWLYVHGVWPTEIDHINQDGLDNRLANLREVSRRTNSENQRFGRNGGLIGTSLYKRRADIRVDGKRISLGYFDTAEEAHETYVQAKRIYHAGCTI